jgi:abortive infection bacteriophage resistance protein
VAIGIHYWLHTLVYIRNICAHHARLWNRILGVRPLIPRHPHHPFISTSLADTQRIYYVMAIIRYWINILEPGNNMTQNLKMLFDNYPDIFPGALGFPCNWQQEPLWAK